jgi:catechol 2,3-dioxygenase-like lactoylglutathione lyase family enzyme
MADTISPYKLAHVVFRTGQYDKMFAFYKTFLGGEVPFDNGELGFIRYDDEHHRVAIAQVPGTTPKDPTSAGLWHVAFTYRSLSDLLKAYAQRKQHGILPSWCVNHGPTTSIYYLDPDNNQIETQIDNFEVPTDADAYMRGPSYGENPIGVNFDPDKLLEMLNDGVSPQMIMQRTDIGPKDFRDIPQAILPAANGKKNTQGATNNHQSVAWPTAVLASSRNKTIETMFGAADDPSAEGSKAFAECYAPCGVLEARGHDCRGFDGEFTPIVALRTVLRRGFRALQVPTGSMGRHYRTRTCTTEGLCVGKQQLRRLCSWNCDVYA